jgi:hypothetical protein
LRAVTCDILSVGRLVLAVVRQQASASGSLISSHLFWYGILLALGRMDPPRADGGLLFVIALLATGLLHPAGGHAHSVGVPYVIVAVIAALAACISGGYAGSGSWANPTSEYAFIMPGESAAVAQVPCPPGGKSGKNQEEKA